MKNLKNTKKSTRKSSIVSKVNKKSGQKQKPIYKKWWFWVIIVIFLAGVASVKQKNEQGDVGPNSNQNSIRDYVGEDAKEVYEGLIAEGYTVKFVFDRNNNGGFSEEQFQDFVINDSFKSEYYKDSSFIITRQNQDGKNITLYIEYGSIINNNKEQAGKEVKLEEKLNVVNAMTACELYGKRNYRNFKMHSVLGQIAEYAYDENTWLLKYYVDVDGYSNKTMECYVTGTTDAPQISKFVIY